MAFCKNCGTQIQDDLTACPSCGQEIGAASAQTQAEQPYNQQATYNAPPQDAERDAQENKTMGILAYILFFVPLLTGAYKTSPFVKFHTNQGTVLCIASVIYSIAYTILCVILAFIPVVGAILIILLGLLPLAFLVFIVLGIMNAAKGKCEPLPLIGGITIIK